MKKITAIHFYPFPIETYVKSTFDECFLIKKFENLGAKDIIVELDTTESGYEIEVDRLVPTDVPGPLKSLLGEWNQIIQKESWVRKDETTYNCQIQIDIEDVPVSMEGYMKIGANGILTKNEIEITVSCGIPLIGGQLEKFVASDIEKTMEKELEFIKSYAG